MHRTTTSSLTNAQVKALREAAVFAGEVELVMTCDLALSRTPDASASRIREARKVCVDVINRGRMPVKSPAELDREIDAWARGVSERAARERAERTQPRHGRVRPGGKRDI